MTLPRRFSQDDLIQLFVFCAFPIHVWSMILELQEIPSMLLQMSVNEIIGSLAYNMLFTLVESLIIYAIVLAIGLLLPRRWIHTIYVPIGSVVLTELSLFMMLFQWFDLQSYSRKYLLVLSLPILLLSILVVPRIPKLNQITHSIANRLTVLTTVYILFDVAGMIIVVTRNL
jgi:hypothetical protein